MDMLRRIMTGVVLVFAVGLVAACAPGAGPLSSNGPETDAWGNPVVKDVGGVPQCAVPSGPAIVPDVYLGGRPADVRPGNAWIVFELTVRAMPAAGGAIDDCVPVAVHVYTSPGEADVVQMPGGAGFETGPFDFTTNTPWTGRYLALQYDPTEERFHGRPPSYEIHMLVTYDATREFGGFSNETPRLLSCAIRLDNGAAVASQVVNLPSPGTAECYLTASSWHTY